MIIADTLGFIGGKMGPLDVNDGIVARIKASGVRLVQWGGPYPYPKNGWSDLIAEVRAAEKTIEKHPDFRLVRSASDLDNIEQTDLIHVVMTVQNPACIEGEWSRLDELWNAGVRVLQLAYMDERDARYGSGFFCQEDKGITREGFKFINSAFGERRFILDLSHLGPGTAEQAWEYSFGCEMISHTASRSVYDHPRNADDGIMGDVVSNDGVVGVLTMTSYLDPEDNSMAPWLRHVEHILKIAGEDHICIGSDNAVGGIIDLAEAEADFRKLSAAVFQNNPLEKKFPNRWPGFVEELNGVNRYRVMAQALTEKFGKRVADKIMGENALNFYRQALP